MLLMASKDPNFGNYESIHHSAGQIKSVTCLSCGAEMNKKFCAGLANCSLNEKARGLHMDYDIFSCPNLETLWHKSLVILIFEYNQTVSPRLANILYSDIIEILRIREDFKPNKPFVYDL